MAIEPKPRVALLVTCLVNVFRPVVAESCVRLLERAGCQVEVPLAQSCCGQPAYNAGDIPASRPLARLTIETFEPFDYVVLPSGSCAGMLVHHYPRLLADDPAWLQRAEALAAKTHEICSFLHDVVGWKPTRMAASELKVCYHDSCAGLRELGVKQQARALLKDCRDIQVQELANTEVCCGFGGTFCAKLPHISVAMADEKLDQAVATGADTLLGGDLGCLLHLAGRARARGMTLEFRHLVEMLAEAEATPSIAAREG